MIFHKLSTRDIEKTMRHGRLFHASHVFFRLKRNNTSPKINRYAFVVSTKVDKRAVVRNTIKRRLKELVRKHAEIIPIGYDVVFIVRASAVHASFEELSRNIYGLLRKSKLG